MFKKKDKKEVKEVIIEGVNEVPADAEFIETVIIDTEDEVFYDEEGNIFEITEDGEFMNGKGDDEDE